MATDSIQVSALIPARPHAVYDAWLSSDLHAKMTGSDASIDPRVGGKHSAWGGYISGETLALDPGKTIEQSWLAQDFPAGSGHSKIVVRLAGVGDHTRVVIDHTEIPAGHGKRFVDGWDEYYFTPMLAFFGALDAEPAAKAKATGKSAAKKSAATKPAAKKSATKSAAKKSAATKPAAKKSVAKKAATNSVAVKKSAAKKSVAKESAAKPAAKKKSVAKESATKPAAKKPAAKKSAAKPAAKKSVAKK